MKKQIFVMAFAAMGATLCAQNVTPINVNIVDFNLDTMRYYAGTDDQYVIDLETVNKQVKADKESIKLANKTAKSERDYYKAQTKINKQRTKQLSAQEKVYKSQAKADKKEQKEIEKQRKALLKDAALDQQSLAQTNASLEQREAKLRDNEHERDMHMRDIKRDREILKDDMIALSSYELDLKDKEAKLKNLDQTNKLQAKMLSNEIKTTKAKIKNNAKMAKLQADQK